MERQYYGIDMSTGIPIGTGPNLFSDYLNRQFQKSIKSIIP